MKRSTERFLTTHTGSLPRPDDLIRMMYAKEEGVPVDPDALARRVTSAVEEVVQKQANAGVDIVDDGEINEQVRAEIAADKRFADTSVWVTTSRKWVTLKGCVRTTAQRNAVVALVHKLKNVERVFDELKIRR